MAISRVTFLNRMERVLAGVPTAEFSEAERREALEAALAEHSRTFPSEVIEDVSGDGGQYYQLGSGQNLVSWEDDFSQVVAVDYPAVDVDVDDAPNWLEREDWAIYRVGSTRYLYFPNHSPNSGETARVWYTVPYTFSSGDTEVPQSEFEAVCALAGAICCEWLAIRYGQHQDSTIAADVVNHRSKSDIYASRAKGLRKHYAELMGQGDAVSPASVVEDVDRGWAVGRDFLFHKRRDR